MGSCDLLRITGGRVELVNIGSTNEMTVLDLVKLIKDITGPHGKYEFSAILKNDLRRRLPDIR